MPFLHFLVDEKRRGTLCTSKRNIKALICFPMRWRHVPQIRDARRLVQSCKGPFGGCTLSLEGVICKDRSARKLRTERTTSQHQHSLRFLLLPIGNGSILFCDCGSTGTFQPQPPVSPRPWSDSPALLLVPFDASDARYLGSMFGLVIRWVHRFLPHSLWGRKTWESWGLTRPSWKTSLEMGTLTGW